MAPRLHGELPLLRSPRSHRHRFHRRLCRRARSQAAAHRPRLRALSRGPGPDAARGSLCRQARIRHRRRYEPRNIRSGAVDRGHTAGPALRGSHQALHGQRRACDLRAAAALRVVRPSLPGDRCVHRGGARRSCRRHGGQGSGEHRCAYRRRQAGDPRLSVRGTPVGARSAGLRGVCRTRDVRPPGVRHRGHRRHRASDPSRVAPAPFLAHRARDLGAAAAAREPPWPRLREQAAHPPEVPSRLRLPPASGGVRRGRCGARDVVDPIPGRRRGHAALDGRGQARAEAPPPASPGARDPGPRSRPSSPRCELAAPARERG